MRKRVDDNQGEIVKGLKKAGYSVCILSDVGNGCPDILVGAHKRNFFFEIKDGSKPPSAQKLTQAEEKFHLVWQGHVSIVRNLDEAFEEIRKHIRNV